MDKKVNSKTYTPDVYFEHVPMFKEGKKDVKKESSQQKTEENIKNKDKEIE